MSQDSRLEKLMRPHMANFATYHGVDPSDELARKAGINPEDVIRLNANENPYEPLEQISSALTNLRLNLYPDPNQRKLRSALSEYTGQPAERTRLQNRSSGRGASSPGRIIDRSRPSFFSAAFALS